MRPVERRTNYQRDAQLVARLRAALDLDPDFVHGNACKALADALILLLLSPAVTQADREKIFRRLAKDHGGEAEEEETRKRILKAAGILPNSKAVHSEEASIRQKAIDEAARRYAEKEASGYEFKTEDARQKAIENWRKAALQGGLTYSEIVQVEKEIREEDAEKARAGQT